MKTCVAARNLTKIYSEGKFNVMAVSPTDLELYEGEVVGLFGPSGSGKTTLLSMIGCILRPTAGSLSIYGNEVKEFDEVTLPEVRKRYMSFIFQGFNLFPALTAYENVMIVLKLKGVKAKEAGERVRSLLSDVGLADRMHFLPRDMSGGQKQRVAVARALAADSPIILADEPTGNLDHKNGRMVMELLMRLAKEQKRSVAVATHDNRIEDIFDRIVYMEDGTITGIERRAS